MATDGEMLMRFVRHQDEGAFWELVARMYPLRDLLPGGDDASADIDELIEVITSSVKAETWDVVGGVGHISAARLAGVEMLFVYQTHETHEDVAVFVRQLRDAIAAAKRH